MRADARKCQGTCGGEVRGGDRLCRKCRRKFKLPACRRPSLSDLDPEREARILAHMERVQTYLRKNKLTG